VNVSPVAKRAVREVLAAARVVMTARALPCRRDMRAAFAAVVVAASLSGLACDDCLRFREVVHKRSTVGDLQYQIGSEVLTHNDIQTLDAAAFGLFGDGAGHYPPGELAFRLGTRDARQDSSLASVVVTIIIGGVSPGAAEIELDDQRARVSAHVTGETDVPYHDITGHLSIRELVQDCADYCPTRANGTLNIYAVGPNDEMLSFTSVTFSAADEVRDGMCINNDG
jgi:hypothetical protein